ncbi:adenylosuccinate synthetase [Anabaena sp. UHCC 0253]|uniref:adenylosuccinate synthetase n=1 Tax=Anabaena sp. UHCC 0253 TaxID=2590019 RepID=UPI0014460B7B|nr:adenylosuccinate synthetase [Anabaena sp. UHCC 0253]MTJ55880.1 adenylosuccinate synthetase [Anabaena sp. UHCC 0253]
MAGKLIVVVGGQFGSEAKGKVISFLANEIDLAIRTGSPNAGNTVIKDNHTYKLQQIPATFVNPKCQLCIGAGALIFPEILIKEIELTQVQNRIYIDSNVGIIEEKHLIQEQDLSDYIGTTKKGCGAALSDRIWRKNFKLAKDVINNFPLYDVAEMANQTIDEGKSVLIAGTQGFGLSLYHGFYPFVTSRDTTAANFLAESGISPRLVTDIILVIRTYPIKVAGKSGIFPNEITWDELSRRIGKKVEERTTVTNNVRRIAEFDIELVKRAILINRPTQIALQFLNYLFPSDENISVWKKLSYEAKAYIEKLENELNVPITLIGTGAAEKAMIDRR